MIEPRDRKEIFNILKTDQNWSAYALADLDPDEPEDKDWFYGERSVVLIYYGLDPPVIFAQGAPEEVEELSRFIPSGRYYYTLMATHRALLGDRLEPEFQLKMWRMWHNPASPLPSSQFDVTPLQYEDLQSIESLFNDHPDQPDSFMPSMLAANTYFGITEKERLVSIAGTHIVSHRYQVAAVGNVYTVPEFRGLGMAQAVTSSVLKKLKKLKIKTIVLNVAMDNYSAIHAYRRIGFWPFCGYYEGLAAFTQTN